MGRITLFGTQDCPHCARAKGALRLRKIPYVEIDVDNHPSRRTDMMSLSDQFSIPQIFFNDTFVGGADQLVQVLEDWVEDADHTSPLDLYRLMIASQPDSRDRRLRLPNLKKEETKEDSRTENAPPTLPEERIPLPDGSSATVLDVMLLLDELLESKDRPYKAHMYKNCFVSQDSVPLLMNNFGCTRSQALQFGCILQTKYHILHHVCEAHSFRDDGYLFFRLQCYHQPEVLNSFRVWTEPVSVVDGPVIVKRLKSMLSRILRPYTDHDGLVDYLQATKDPHYPAFEEATCALQGIDMALMDETTRKAFALNLYNLMITYAFLKRGIGTSILNRGAFFSQVKMNVGGDILTFNDVENGILRANTRHPYVNKAPFARNDPRIRLALSTLDPRIHFALNCGAKSCPPVQYFHAESLNEELRVVALSFCEGDDVLRLNEAKQEIKLSMLLKWFQADFCDRRDGMPTKLLEFVRGPKRQTLLRMTETSLLQPNATISLKYQTYDWSSNASRFVPYSQSKLKANALSAEALLRFQGHFVSLQSPCRSSQSVHGTVVVQ